MTSRHSFQEVPNNWVRLGARVFGTSLDEHLAQGEGPDANAFLGARALQLTSRRLRRSIADSWLDVLIQARQKLTPFDLRIPVVRRRVLEAEDQIRAVADALVAPLTTARGVAMASSLLSDGAGPLYNPGSTTDLRFMLVDVLRQLDPLALSA
jgi:hypothetical protein